MPIVPAKGSRTNSRGERVVLASVLGLGLLPVLLFGYLCIPGVSLQVGPLEIHNRETLGQVRALQWRRVQRFGPLFVVF